MRLPELAGVLSANDVRRTAESIAAAQEPDGGIPWFPGGHLDPWDHIEAAMGLDVGGLHGCAVQAYRWLARHQRVDGSWAAAYRAGRVQDATTDTNFCAYIAVGVWHHYLVTGDRLFLHELWPAVHDAIEYVAGLQTPGGEIVWAVDPDGQPSAESLLTSCSSMYQSLRCALAIAGQVGQDEPGWELVLGRLGHAILHHPERFAPKHRWSMDWYYPVLGGALRGSAADARIEERWRQFVVDDLGVRCVADRPWVTGAETCELALTLDALGDRTAAVQMIVAMQHLRHRDGSYWTGYVYDDRERWPVERSTWTAAAVLLAVDSLAGSDEASALFRGDGLPNGVDPAEVVCTEGLSRLCDATEYAERAGG